MIGGPIDLGRPGRRRAVASRNWMPISTAPEGVEVETKIDDKDGCRNEQTLIRFGCCWFIPDKGIYVYYEPTHWRPMRKETGCGR